MDQFQYVIPFIGIIYGFGATILLENFYQILARWKTIKFHPVPLMWAASCFLIVINGWWAFFAINKQTEVLNAGHLLILSILPSLSFLVCASVLPSKINIHEKKEFCLWQYYKEQMKLFLFLLAAYLIAIEIVLCIMEVKDYSWTLFLIKLILPSTLVFIAFFEKKWMHYVVSIYFLLSLTITLFQQVLV